MMDAKEALQKAQQLIDQRGKDYDHEGGERSMGPAVAAFNALTGHNLTEGDGWLLFDMVKTRRTKSSPGHVDSNLDKISYAALRAEAELRDANKPAYDADATLRAMADPEFWCRKENGPQSAQGSRCVSETSSETIRESQDENARSEHDSESDSEPYCGAYQAYNVDVNACLQCRRQWRADEPKPCERKAEEDRDIANRTRGILADDGEGWIDHDGSGRCPVSDPTVRLDTRGVGGLVHFNFHDAPASHIDWPNAARWRVAEVNGWRRWSGVSHNPPMPQQTKVRAVHRDGAVSMNCEVWALHWDHKGMPSDIIAYRVEKDGD